jgi:hypothetical protein
MLNQLRHDVINVLQATRFYIGMHDSIHPHTLAFVQQCGAIQWLPHKKRLTNVQPL